MYNEIAKYKRTNQYTGYNKMDDLGWYTIVYTNSGIGASVVLFDIMFTNYYSYKYASAQKAKITFGFKRWGKIISADAYTSGTLPDQLTANKIRILYHRDDLDQSYAYDTYLVQIYTGNNSAAKYDTTIFIISNLVTYYPDKVKLAYENMFYASDDTLDSHDTQVAIADFTLNN